MLRTELIRPLHETLRAHAEEFGAKTAFRDEHRAVSYAELEARTRNIAGHLAGLRLQPGDRAAIYLGNSVEMVESYLAITRASAIGVPVNPRSTDAELAYLIDDSGARVIVSDPAHLDQLRRVLAGRSHVRLVLTGVDVVPAAAPDGTVAFTALAGSVPADPARDDLGLDDLAWMLYTSGTTGRPKGVLSTQRNCLWSVAACYVPVPGLSASDRVVWPLPLFHSLSHIVCVLGVTSVGATARIVDGFAAEEVLEALREESATFLAGVPTMYHYLVAAARERGFHAPDLRMCLVGGAITTAALRRDFEDVFGAPLLDAYGSTETCGSITINWPTGARVEGSCGLPVPGLGVRLVHPETLLDVAHGDEGEVWVSGPSVMAGYHNQPEATAAAIRDRWYRTGDLARRDEAGYFTITGRIKELIIRGGENIHPGEIEEVVRGIPGVVDVAVAGKPHDVLGEVPVAYIVPGPGGVDPEQIFAACRERLSYFKVPEELYEIARVPRTASGKVTRLALLRRPARLLAASSGFHENLFTVQWTPLPSTEASVPVSAGDPPAVPRRWAVIGPDAEVLAAEFAGADAEAVAYHDVAALVSALAGGAPVPDAAVLRAGPPGIVATAGVPLEKAGEVKAGSGAVKSGGRRRKPGTVSRPADVPDASQGGTTAVQRLEILTAEAGAWLAAGHLAAVPLVLLTRGAVVADGDGPGTDLAAAPAWGWGRGIQLAHPGRFILADHDEGSSVLPALTHTLAAGETQVAVRGGVLLAPQLTRADASAEPVPLASPDSTVLITGAEGASAAAVARHLAAAHHVRNFLLASPRGSGDPAAAELAAELQQWGASVVAGPGDPASLAVLAGRAPKPVSTVIFTIGEPELTGTDLVGFTAAGALAADALARGLGTPPVLLLSSGAGQLGSAADPYEGAAAAYLDVLAQTRAVNGLPGAAISLGGWTTPASTGNRSTTLAGFQPLDGPQAMAMFDAVATAGRPVLFGGRLDPATLGGAGVPAVFRGLVDAPARAAAPDDAVTTALRGRLAPLSPAGRELELLGLVRAEAAEIRLTDAADIDAGRPFKELGYTSVQAVELRGRLTAATGLRLPATLAFDYPTPAAVAGYLHGRLYGTAAPAVRAAPARTVRGTDDPIVIVGMACRLPGGVASPDDLWNLVDNGVDAISGFPADRGWDLASLYHPDPDHPGTTYLTRGGFLHDAGSFDAGFFGISPREALATDPQQRLLLESSWEALEDAGIDPGVLKGASVGVFTGVMYREYGTNLDRAPEGTEGYLGIGSAGSVVSGRVAYTFGFEGPAITVDTACSSSLVALHLAAQSLRAGECDMALAGGVAVMSLPTSFVEFSRQRGLAADGIVRAYGAGAEGTVWSEGAGILVVERQSDAVANGHRILAVVRGSAVNQDGASNGLTAPNGPAQQRVIQAALASGGIGPDGVAVVEGHGTGTSLGDPIEAHALLAVYGAGRPADDPLWLGSLKSNVGHAQAAAGVLGVIKMVEALRHETLPRTLHADERSPHIDWAAGGVELLTEARPWPVTAGTVRRAGVSSFGVSGTNAHVIVEEPPPPAPTTETATTEPSPVPLLVTAKSAAALRAQAARLADRLDRDPGHRPALADVGWSLASSRARFDHRAVVVAADHDDAAAALRAFASDTGTGAIPTVSGQVTAGQLAALFTGQGAQRAGMGAGLYERFPVFASAFDAVTAELDPLLDRPLKTVVFAAPGSDGAALLDQTAYTQPALFAVEVALFRLVESWGVSPDFVAGHSIGELAAAHVAGVFSLADAARIVAARGRLMQDLPAGGAMVAVSAPEADVLPLLRDRAARVAIGAVNGPSSVVISGAEAEVLAVAAELDSRGVRTRRLTVSHAFHSPLMEPMLDQFRQVVASAVAHAPVIGVVSTLTGELARPADLADPEYWVRHVRHAVRFGDAVQTLAGLGTTTFLEVGPGGVLTGLGRGTATAETSSFVAGLRHDQPEPETILSAAGHLYVRGHAADFTPLFPGATRIGLPTYAFQRDHYWLLPSGSGGRPSGLGLGDAEHPLLSAIVPLPDGEGMLFSGALSLGTHPWLADHQVTGRIIVPGAALVEMAVRAGDETGAARIDELIIEQPLVIADGGSVHIQVIVGAPDDAGRRPLTIRSRPAPHDAAAGWVRHVSGALATSSADPGSGFASGAWPPPGATEQAVDGFYERRAGDGIAYGPSFQGLRRVWLRDGEVFGEAALPHGTAGDTGRFGLHPALLDAALHVSGFNPALASHEGGAEMPFAWRDVSLHAAGATAVRVRVTAGAAPGEISLELADETGTPVATIGGLTFRPVAVAAGAEHDEHLFTIGWPAVPVAPAPDAKVWAAIGEPGAVTVSAVYATTADLLAALGDGHAAPDVLLLSVAGGDPGPDRARETVSRVLGQLQELLPATALTDTRLVVATRGGIAVHHVAEVTDPSASAVWGLVRTAQSEEPGRVILADLDGTSESALALAAAVASGEEQVAIRAGNVHVPRLARAASGELRPPATTTWRLDSSGSTLQDLALVPAPEALAPLGAGEVRIGVRAAGVNFRDVLIALGMVPGQTGIGGEAAGVILETGADVTDLRRGDRVMAMIGEFGAFGPVVVTDRRLVAPLPAGWTFEQGATVPIAFLTALYGLRDLARLRTGEKILINAAAGGVGMAAAQLARHFGATVYGTASAGKWAALAGIGLPPERLASSRTTGFRGQFLDATGGDGMDVVLNSLAGEFADASLALLPRGGRFLELGKTDIRDADDVAAAYPGVGYQVYDLRDAGPDRIGELLAELSGLFTAGVIAPPPVTAWDVRRAPEAFRYLSQARHIGKVALTVPRDLDPDGTVLISGGGSLGALVARDLVGTHGARRLILASRRGPAADGTAELTAELTAAGAYVEAVACDLSDRDAVAGLLGRVPAAHPLTAVVHTAGVIDDGMIPALDAARVGRVFGPKADAAWHLHELTAGTDLAAFVLFSSASGVFGNPGQGNYSAANGYLDGLAQLRRAAGLPASALAWGFWSHASELTAQLDSAALSRTKRDGMLGIDAPTGMALFATGLRPARAALVPARLDLAGLRARAGAEPVPPLLRGLVRPARRTAQTALPPGGGSLARTLAGLSAAEQDQLLIDLVRTQAATVLGHPAPDLVVAGHAFKDIGFDSLTAVELRNRLNGPTGLRLGATVVFDYPTPEALAGHLRDELIGRAAAPAPVPARTSPLTATEPIAIVGMSCRFPAGVNSPEDLWRLLESGGEVTTDFPANRGWDVESLYDPDPDRLGTSYVRRGGFLEEMADFDADFFGISPREATAMDPQQRLLLETSWEAFERAGIDPTSVKGRNIGVFTGVINHDYSVRVHDSAPELEGYRLTGISGSVASGRVAYTLGLEGPAITVDTACSSSLVALHLATQALRSGECDMALAGGVTVMTTPDNFIEFSRQRGLATDARCKAFGAGADGTAWSEGVGVLLVERLSDAVAKNHQILAVVRGTAVNQDGASNGLTAPNGPSQQRVIRAALAAGDLTAAEVDIVEAHGTGTALGDPIEAQALLAVYGEEHTAGNPLWLGSVKSNIGHTQGAAGVASIIKMVMALRHGAVPRTLHADVPSPHIDWSSGALRLLTEPKTWLPGESPRRAGISSFGVSGTNAHVIIEEAPDTGLPGATAPALDGPVPLLLSAKSEPALHAQAGRLADWLDGADDVPLGDAGWSLTTGRARLDHRAVVIASDHTGAVSLLRALEAGTETPGVTSGTVAPGSLALLFTGQGAQRAGMGAALYAQYPVFAAAADEVTALLDTELAGYGPADRVHGVWDVMSGAPGTEGLLDETGWTQPALFTFEVALFRLLESWGVRPDLVLGHSVGEVAAAYAAGLFSLEDAVRVVAARGRLMQELPAGGAMVAVAAPESVVRPLLAGREDRVAIGAVNGPSSVVLSGAGPDVLAVAETLAGTGVRTRRLTVSHAFHSPLMEPMLDGFRRVLDSVAWHSPRLRFVSSVTGEIVDAPTLADAGYWLGNVRQPVRFADAVAAAHAAGAATFIEVGPGGVLTALGRESVADDRVTFTAAHRHDRPEDVTALTAAGHLYARGHAADFAPLFPGASVTDLPTYAFQRQRYWVGNATPGTAGIDGAGLSGADHPLLSAIVQRPEGGGVIATGRLSLDSHPWLADHAIGGTVLVPGTALVELAARAADESGASVSELVIETPLVLPRTGAVHLQVSVGEPDGTGSAPLAIHSRPAGASPETAWSRHAAGAVSATVAPPSPGLTEWPPPGATEADLAGFYERQHAAGYEYGPVFQGLRRVWTSGDEVFAEVELDAGQYPDAARYGLHPALLDAVLHATSFGAVTGTEPGRLLLPFAWNGVTLHTSGAVNLRARIAVTGADTVALRLADQTGAPVADVAALVFRPVAIDSIGSGQVTPGLSKIDWSTPVELPGQTGPAAVLDPSGRDCLAVTGPRYPDPAALIAALTSGSAPLPETVFFAPADTLGQCAPAPDGETRPADAARARDLVGRTLAVLQAWADEPVLQGIRLAVITRGGAATSSHDATAADPAASAVWGLVRTAQSEHPGRFTIIDVDVDDASAAVLEAVAAAGEPQAAIRAGIAVAPRAAAVTGAPELTGGGGFGSGTVLITGGTGALGSLVARHLAERHGVRSLLLLSRRGEAAAGAADLAAELARLGADARFAAADAANREELASALAGIPADRPLSAVIHTAGVLDDHVLSGLDAGALRTVFAPKADAAWHLHELTRAADLRAFVMFSSIAGILGNPGQANYAAANTYLDGLAWHRHGLGLPAVSLAWSLWDAAVTGSASDGVTGGMAGGDGARRGRRSGIEPLTAATGLALLDAALVTNEPVLVPAVFDHVALAGLAADGKLPALLRGRVRATRRAAQAARSGESAGLAGRLAGLGADDRERVVVDLVRAEAAAVLGGSGPEAVRADQAFKDVGFDSLAAVELRNRLSAVAGVRLPATLIFDYPTPAALAGLLLTHVAPETGSPAADSAGVFLGELDRLERSAARANADEEIRAQVAARLRRLSSVWEQTGPGTVLGEHFDLDAATDQDLFDLMDNEFGRS